MIDNEVSKEEYELERAHLRQLVSIIEERLANYKDYVPEKGVEKYTVGIDYDDANALARSKDINEYFYKTEIEPWKEHIDSPYFGKLVATVDGKEMTFYISDSPETLYLNGKIEVYSVYSDIGDFFNDTFSKEKKIKAGLYKSFLRRKFIIRNKRIEFIEDVYVAGLDPKYQDVTDPYLITILKSKRHSNELTSIMTSIQENQYKIVWKPRNESLIVQGCAGSGKTAILFHRLAKMRFDDPTYIDKTVRIISPNDGFTKFVRNFSASLKLDAVVPVTLDEYYSEALKRYNVAFNHDVELNGHSTLSQDFLNEIYSDTVIEKIYIAGKKYIKEKLEDINFQTFVTLMTNHDIVFKKENDRNLQAISSFFEKCLNYIDGEYRAHIVEIEPKLNKYEPVIKELEKKLNVNFDEDISKILASEQSLKSSIFECVREFNNEVDSNGLALRKLFLSNPPTERDLIDLESSAEALSRLINEQSESLNKELENTKKELEEINKEDYSDWKNVELPKLLEEKKNCEEFIEGSSFFSIIRRSRYEARIKQIDEEINKVNELISSKEKRLNEINQRIARISSKIDHFDGYDNERILYFSQRVSDLVNKYRVVNLYKTQGKYIIGRKQIEKARQGIKRILDSKTLSLSEMNKAVVSPLLKQIASKYGYLTRPNSDSINGKYYEFHKYLILNLANMFMYKPFYSDKLICIDEAQEYSINELVLLADINSRNDKRVVLNIYGDINQRNSLKGIKDWHDIMPLITNNYFELKENYRNSTEIVKYTNEKLKLNDIAIGLDDGHPVKEISYEEAIKLIKEKEMCIIIKKDNPLYEEIEMRGLLNKRVGDIVVLTPWLAKGQEFTSVLVFDGDMDNIEKYISYTRAKSELFVCH